MSRAGGQRRPHPFGDRPRLRQAKAGQNDQQGIPRPANRQIGSADRPRQRLAHAFKTVTRRIVALICAMHRRDIQKDDAQRALFTAQPRQLARNRDIAGGAIEQRGRDRGGGVFSGLRDRRPSARLNDRGLSSRTNR